MTITVAARAIASPGCHASTSDLLEEFFAVFPSVQVAYLTTDREFVGGISKNSLSVVLNRD